MRHEVACGQWGFAPIGQANANATTFNDASAQAGTTYTYRIRSFAGGLYSDPSNTATAATPP